MKKSYCFAAVEDDGNELATFEGMLSTFFKEEGEEYILKTFTDAESFLLESGSFDAVFFDIELPGMTGMELSKRMREKGDETFIIFITHMAQFAIEGYSVSALDFVLKPLVYPQFKLKMKKLMRAIESRPPSARSIQIKRGGSSIFLTEADIAYLEVRGHTLTYHCLKEDFVIRSSMNEEKEKLSSLFAHCSDSFLVNLSFVQKIERTLVHLSFDGKEIPLPLTRKYKDEFKKRYLSYLEGAS